MNQARVPAWKKLGLKLKYANEVPARSISDDAFTTAQQNGYNVPVLLENHGNRAEPPRKKQKTAKNHDKKDAVLESAEQNTDLAEKKLKKQVSFSADTKSASLLVDGLPLEQPSKTEEPKATINGKKPKKKKSGRKPQQPLFQKSNTVLEYLDQYRSDRSRWKFNKNRETWILKHIFSETDIPPEYDIALAQYIHGLQGSGARERLKIQCLERPKLESKTETNGENDTTCSEQNEKYSELFRREVMGSSSADTAEKGDEDKDEEYTTWLHRQSRPKILLWALGLGDATILSNGSASERSEEARGKNGTTTTKTKKRKNRTLVVDYESSSSSSSSESEDESDSSHQGRAGGAQLLNGHAGGDETSSSGTGSGDDSSESDSDSGSSSSDSNESS